MKNLLVIQSRMRPEMIEAERAEYCRAVGDETILHYASTLDTTLDWQMPQTLLANMDGVILGGSGEFDLDGGRGADDPARVAAHKAKENAETLAAYIIERDIPFLGVCFGHQLVADVRSGRVTNDHAQKKVGTFDVWLTDVGRHDPLFTSLPSVFPAQYGHKDSVTSLPQGAELLAFGDSCAFSALRYGSRAYTVQFHPELTEQDVIWKLKNSPGYLPEGVSAESIVRPSPDASAIIPLFIENIVRRSVSEARYCA
jgi:GMP synthase (glutamine-hydrolysing)